MELNWFTTVNTIDAITIQVYMPQEILSIIHIYVQQMIIFRLIRLMYMKMKPIMQRFIRMVQRKNGVLRQMIRNILRGLRLGDQIHGICLDIHFGINSSAGLF